MRRGNVKLDGEKANDHVGIRGSGSGIRIPNPTSRIPSALDGRGHAFHREDFDDVSHLEIVVALEADTALEPLAHFGIETGYTLSGSASFEVEGEPPRLLKAGDSYVVPLGKVHDAKVVGDAPARVLAVYVVEKGKPLATPAP